jgi:hypothetical protein
MIILADVIFGLDLACLLIWAVTWGRHENS